MNRAIEFEKSLYQQTIELVKETGGSINPNDSNYANSSFHNDYSLKQLKSNLIILNSGTTMIPSSGDLNNNDLNLAWNCLSLFKHCANYLVNQTLPIIDHMGYYDSVLDSGPIYGLAVYAIQNGPSWMMTLKEPKLKIIDILKNPLQYSAVKVSTHRKELKTIRDTYARKLGKLVAGGFVEKQDMPTTVINTINLMYSIMVPTGNNSATPPLEQMLEIIDHGFDNDELDNKVLYYGKPNFVTRYWPTLAIAGATGVKILGNWAKLLEWVKTNLIETTISLWNNWIVAPVWKIYQTIRHDENAQIALMTKHSLDSDMKSLERMVVDLVGKDHSNNEIVAAVQQGDLSSVLSRYEKQIQSPIKSIINGQLIRSILIQVQKTKVDVEVAMNGIDKMLQSQQLVFGLIAALPSFFILWYSFGFLSKKTASRNRRTQSASKAKNKLKIALGTIDHILVKSSFHNSSKISEEHIGLIICHTHNARLLAKSVTTSQERYKQLVSRLNKLEDLNSLDTAQSDLRDIFIQFSEINQ